MKDKILKEKLIDCLPNEQIHQLPDDVGSLHETEYDFGWNSAIRDIKLHSIDKMIEVLREEMRDKVKKFMKFYEYHKDDYADDAFNQYCVSLKMGNELLELLSTPSVGEVE